MGTDNLTPSIACRRSTKKSLRALKAFTIAATSSPPAFPSPIAATPAFCEMLHAPEVNWTKRQRTHKYVQGFIRRIDINVLSHIQLFSWSTVHEEVFNNQENTTVSFPLI